ncbi:hypothetical protein RhiirC2_790203 [Rhizophagus irregularis]|uniref:Uncharacterized protein n=1 Tax=Rhizophagus irregularis TaxID=588596 RepID=A0A2N1MLN8_9GLOM|nr:hypothetical protein RhiirC2_790203 [Rhizophagus irregularis]
MGVKNYFDKMFILTDSEEWTMSMKDYKDMFLDSYISLIKASEGKIVVDKVIM